MEMYTSWSDLIAAFRAQAKKSSMAKCVCTGNMLLLGGCLVTDAVADNYDYELRVLYDRGNSDTVSTALVGGVPTPSLGVSKSSSDSNNIILAGAWYYSALSDNSGPRSRAAFLSRASSISVDYTRGDDSSSFTFTGSAFPPTSGSSDATYNSISARLRHVWRDSGWYALAGVSRSEAELDFETNGTVSSADSDATGYTLGVGKYFGRATAVDLSAATTDTEGFDSTNFNLSLAHIGSIGKRWQYGTDVALARSDQDGDEGSYSLRGSLYPSPELEFGLGYSRRQFNGGLDLEALEGFMSWFVRDHVGLTARYWHDISNESIPGRDTDNNQLGVGISVRF